MDHGNPLAASCRGEGVGPGQREVLLWIVAFAALRMALAAFVTGFTLVDDAYITLRYARHGAETGALVYNHGEAVFGVTSPLWAFVTTGLMCVFGRAGIEVAVTALGVVLWSWASWIAVRETPARARRAVLALMLGAPVFVDNQLLGMETPLVVLLAVGALGAARAGALTRAAAWAGWLMVARPEGVLFAPALLGLGAARHGAHGLARGLLRPAPLALLLGPGLAWVGFALLRYGTVLPQSMVAKSGWHSEHYDGLATALGAWFGLARLTFVPFVDHLPLALAHGVTGALVVTVLWVAVENQRRGTAWSRAWFGTYLLFLGFYLVGKGATEASWYAVPPSVALLLGSTPALERLGGRVPERRRRAAAAWAGASLAAASGALALQRAPLLRSYGEGAGACARSLAARAPGPDEAVLIGEIGVFGFMTEQPVVDVGALVSPEVLPLKNAGLSLVSIARATGATWLVISDVAVERNHYPSVGPVWADGAERRWLGAAEPVAHHRDKTLLRLPRPASGHP